MLGTCSRGTGKNGRRLRTRPSPGPSFCLGRPPPNEKMTPLSSMPTMSTASFMLDNLLTFYVVFFFIIFGLRGAKGTSVTVTPSKGCFIRPGWPPSRLAWPPGKPLEPPAPTRTVTFSLKLRLLLENNGFIWTFLGRTTPSSNGISSPLLLLEFF